MLLRRTNPTAGPHQAFPLFPSPFTQTPPNSIFHSLSCSCSSSSSRTSSFCRIVPRFDSILMQIDLLDGGGAWSKQEDDAMMSSEESSSYPDHSELELGLGLSLGGGTATAKAKQTSPTLPPAASWGHYGRILTGSDFPPVVSTKASSSSSSSSSVTKVNSSGSKRTADSPCSPPGRSAIRYYYLPPFFCLTTFP